VGVLRNACGIKLRHLPRSLEAGVSYQSVLLEHGIEESNTAIDFPPAIDGPSAWYGPDVSVKTGWIQHFSFAELAEIEEAARRLAREQGNWQTLGREDFPLPLLKQRLCHVLEEVLQGRGFAVLRGLPVERWGRRLSAVAFLGLGLHWGNLRPQN